MKLSIKSSSIVYIAIIISLLSCKRDEKDKIIYDELRFIAIDETDGVPIEDLPITILEFESTNGGWGFSDQKEIFIGNTDANGEINIQHPVKENYRYRFWKKWPNKNNSKLSADWSFFDREYFIEWDTFPPRVVMKLKPSGYMVIHISDSSFINSGYDSISVENGTDRYIDYYGKKEHFKIYRKPNISHPFLITAYKNGVIIQQYSENIFFKNFYSSGVLLSSGVYEIKPK